MRSGKREGGGIISTIVLSFRVESELFFLGRTLALPPDARSFPEAVVPSCGRTVPYVWIESESPLTPDDVIGEKGAVGDVRKIATDGIRQLFHIQWREVDSPLLDNVCATDGAIQTLEGRRGSWKFTVRFPSESAVSEFHDYCIDDGVSLEVLQLRQGLMRGETSSLSGAQRESLREALDRGYFDVPRRVSLKDLAERIGISDSAFSQRLRRGMRTVLRREFEEGTSEAK